MILCQLPLYRKSDEMIKTCLRESFLTKELYQKLKQIRNDCEMSQEKLYQIAREKSYYVPAAKATDQEISHVKNILAGISTH